jgi:hypothetical protein
VANIRCNSYSHGFDRPSGSSVLGARLASDGSASQLVMLSGVIAASWAAVVAHGTVVARVECNAMGPTVTAWWVSVCDGSHDGDVVTGGHVGGEGKICPMGKCCCQGIRSGGECYLSGCND